MTCLTKYDLSAKLTSLFIYSCHQQPDRSFWLLGYPIALCCRCLGFYLGVAISTIVALIGKFNLKLRYFVIFYYLQQQIYLQTLFGTKIQETSLDLLRELLWGYYLQWF